MNGYAQAMAQRVASRMSATLRRFRPGAGSSVGAVGPDLTLSAHAAVFPAGSSRLLRTRHPQSVAHSAALFHASWAMMKLHFFAYGRRNGENSSRRTSPAISSSSSAPRPRSLTGSGTSGTPARASSTHSAIYGMQLFDG